jgi:hypothetical protein
MEQGGQHDLGRVRRMLALGREGIVGSVAHGRLD